MDAEVSMDAVDPTDAGPAIYVGESRFLHWWPRLMLALALLPIVVGASGAAALFVVPAMIAAFAMPWRFAVVDHGIGLWFGFGRYRFLAKDDVTVRVGLGSAVLFRRPAERFGYPLTDGIVEHDRAYLRAILAAHGFRLAG